MKKELRFTVLVSKRRPIQDHAFLGAFVISEDDLSLQLSLINERSYIIIRQQPEMSYIICRSKEK